MTPIGAALSEDNVGIGVADAMNKLFGKHEGFRAFHAKGTVVEGSFKGTSDGAALSKAAIFNGTSIPVTVRFSDNGGFPNIADGAADANPRGVMLRHCNYYRQQYGLPVKMPVSKAAAMLESKGKAAAFAESESATANGGTAILPIFSVD